MKRMKEGQNWSKGGYKKQKEMNVVWINEKDEVGMKEKWKEPRVSVGERKMK